MSMTESGSILAVPSSTVPSSRRENNITPLFIMNPMMILGHSESLDKLIELIPERFYLPDDEEDRDK
ncbi:hypothetical protein F2Q69_00016793 [Brassica cretica]|uniref:Ribosomal RNA-processing protein 14 N-terminal domain-containing protein n=1 Tax=Brassica cretica TaxID=69181 RepID=A0A8S9QS83_BRACR|nr:hypothetical protein F2Q69_00016793 [Brassica cretica]